MSVSREDVLYIAKLAKLEIPEEALDKNTANLSSIVDFANELAKVDVEGVEPTAHILNIQNVFREDKVEKSCKREDILKNAPDVQAGCISVPKFME